MRALRLCVRPTSAVQLLGMQAGSWAAAYVQSHRFSSDSATATASKDAFTAEEDGAPFTTNLHDAEDVAEHPDEPRQPLAVKLLRYVYATNTHADDSCLALPQGNLRVQRLLNVDSTADLKKDADSAKLDTITDCTRYINLVAAYIRHEEQLQQRENASSAALRERAARRRAQKRDLFLSPEEQSAMLRKACALVEQRRVPVVAASRLLRYYWPDTLRHSAPPRMRRYVTELVRSWIAEELQEKRVTPRDARALLNNCAAAFKLRGAEANASHRGRPSPADAITRAEGSDLAAFIRSLADIATSDITSPAQAEGLIAVMWAVHVSGCAAPSSFWEAMVRRVGQLNTALDGQLAEVVEEDKEEGVGEASAASVRGASSSSHKAGHFFSALTTRQLYRFLLVLKQVKWNGDVAVLHQLADQALRNVAFELESLPTSSIKGKQDHASDKATVEPAAAPPTSPSTPNDSADSLPRADRQHAKREIKRRIRLVADMQPREFFELLSLAADLRVPLGISAARISAELITPLVPHLSTKDLVALLKIVRHTQSQSTELLQAIMARLIESGPSIPYALTLSKTLIRTAATAPDLFTSMEMDDFVSFFLDLCEAQFSVCRPVEVSSLADVLYMLGRRYDEASPPGQRIRAVVNLFCAHVDRLLQLQVVSTTLAEPLLEATVLLRMRPHRELYPAVQELLSTRTVAEEQQQARNEKLEETRLRYLDAAVEKDAESAARETSSRSDGLGPRWENIPEKNFPTLSRAALSVYGEVAYMFERMAVMKAKLKGEDFSIFEKDIGRAGLYSLLQGVQLFQHGHLEAEVAYTTSSAKAAAESIPRVLPRWMERTISRLVLRKIAGSGLTASSTDDETLKVLGHVHCDAAKVDAVVGLIVESPLQLLKHQRPLWLYVRELSRRFGSEETKKSVELYLSKSLF